MNNGVPPTERNALTGELTPPGNNSLLYQKELLVVSSNICFGFHIVCIFG